MKRFFAVILSVLLVLAFIVSSALAGGGSTQLSEEQLAQIADVQKRKINRLEFFFVPTGVDADQIGLYSAAKYKFSVNVNDGAYDAEFQGIEVGGYSVYAYASTGEGNWAFKDEKIPLNVAAGKNSILSVNFKLNNSMVVAFKLPVSVGNFVEGEYYDVNIQNQNMNAYSAYSGATYQNGNLNFSLVAYQPYPSNAQVMLSVTDKNGSVINFTVPVNIMDYVAANGQPIILTPVVLTTGTVEAQIKFAHEMPMSGKLIAWNGLNTIYYLLNGKRYYVTDGSDYGKVVMDSWGWTESMVNYISQSELESIPLGSNVTIRPGTYLIKVVDNNRVFIVENGDNLRRISAEALPVLYGNNWRERLVIVPDAFFTNYRIIYPDNAIKVLSNGASNWLSDLPVNTIIDCATMEGDGGLLVGSSDITLLSPGAVSANRYNRKFFVNFPADKIGATIGREGGISANLSGYSSELDYNPN